MKKDQPIAEDYLKDRAWKKFLLSVPLGRPRGYCFQYANDIQTLRVIASRLNKSEDCGRRFAITDVNLDSKTATIEATLTNK